MESLVENTDPGTRFHVEEGLPFLNPISLLTGDGGIISCRVASMVETRRRGSPYFPHLLESTRAAGVAAFVTSLSRAYREGMLPDTVAVWKRVPALG